MDSGRKFLTLPRDPRPGPYRRPGVRGWLPSGPLLVGLVAVVLVQAAAPASANAQEIGLPIGAMPEAVVLEDLDGNAVDLGDVIGTKPVLLEFWATWCPVCQALEPELSAAAEEFGDEVEFIIVAVAVNQTPRRVRRHVESHEMPGRVLWDGQGRAVRAFKTPTTSYIVILDAAGKVAYTGAGEDQDLRGALAALLERVDP